MILDNGEILQYGETFEVYNNPINIKVMELLSRLGLNIIDLEIVGGKFSRPFQLIFPMVYINYVLDQKKLKSAIRG